MNEILQKTNKQAKELEVSLRDSVLHSSLKKIYNILIHFLEYNEAQRSYLVTIRAEFFMSEKLGKSPLY